MGGLNLEFPNKIQNSQTDSDVPAGKSFFEKIHEIQTWIL